MAIRKYHIVANGKDSEFDIEIEEHRLTIDTLNSTERLDNNFEILTEAIRQKLVTYDQVTHFSYYISEVK